MATEHLSPRVNSAKLPEFVGKTVRLPCRVLQRSADILTVEATDNGEVTVQLFQSDFDINAPYIEVVGKAVDATTVKLMSMLNLGKDLDMKLVNDAIEFIHNPRIFTRMFN